MIYADSSALLELVCSESETAALTAWLQDHPAVPVVSSVLAMVEVIRAARRLDATAVPGARTLLVGVDLIPMAPAVIEAAGALGDALRSLDAIRLASALSIRSYLSAFVAYDRHLTEAAQAEGLPCVAPGVLA